MLAAEGCTSSNSAVTAHATSPASAETVSSTSNPSSSTSTTPARLSASRTQRIVAYLAIAEPKLLQDWQSIADGFFPADTAHPVSLEIGLLSSGSLEDLVIVAYANEGKLLTATGFYPAGDSIAVSGAVVDGVSVTAVQPGTVASYMAVLDRVGPRTILAKLPSFPPSVGSYPGDYLLEAWPRSGGSEDIPNDAKAFIWDGSALQPVPAHDARRHTDPRYACFVATPNPSYISGAGPDTPTTIGMDTSPVFFVIPLAAVGSR
jgi:hypothetical protein